MTKFKKVELTDFDFSKKINRTPNLLVERLIVTAFIGVFGSLLFFSPSYVNLNLDKIQYEPIPQVIEQNIQYPDYIVTPEDNKLFNSIFVYESDYNLKSGKLSGSFQDQIREFDILNNPFDNKTKNFHVSSKILAIEPSNKTEMVAATGNANLDFVDIVVQKTYKSGKDVYYEQDIVSLTLDNHKIVEMKTNRMID